MAAAHRFLTFRHGAGSARCGNVTIQFQRCPRVPGMRFAEIEYVPRVHAQVLSEDDPEHWRPMSEVECLIVDKVLHEMLEAEQARWS
jgi:hypothetical protein